MHIITQARIWGAKDRFPETTNALEGWYRVMKKNVFNSFSEIKRSFGSVDKVGDDKVGDFFVFDIGGNKLRLIANIHFNRHKVYIRYVLTHKEYDRLSLK